MGRRETASPSDELNLAALPTLFARDVVELLTLQLEGHPRIEERGTHEVAHRDSAAIRDDPVRVGLYRVTPRAPALTGAVERVLVGGGIGQHLEPSLTVSAISSECVGSDLLLVQQVLLKRDEVRLLARRGRQPCARSARATMPRTCTEEGHWSCGR